MSVNEIIAIVGVVALVVTQVARLTYFVAQVRTEIKRLQKDYGGCYYARDHGEFEKRCDERHGNIQKDLDEVKESLGKILSRNEFLRRRLAVIGDALNGKRFRGIAEDTES